MPEHHTDSWQSEWGRSLRTADQLAQFGLIEPSNRQSYDRLLATYRLAIPRYYAELIDPTDPHCPIRRQALADISELESGWGETDPLRDLEHQPVARLTHRFSGRVLVHPTSNCSMYCRYCFRKSLLNEHKEQMFGGADLSEAFAYIRHTTQVEEVIFSGGDPLMLKDEKLAQNMAELESISHVKRIRFHTRVPVTFPNRVTDSLVTALRPRRCALVFVLHFNHPKEVTVQTTKAASKLLSISKAVLNQSVLLKGVNDCAETLGQLSNALFECRILPYYLHHLDKTRGTRHFFVSYEKGRSIFRQLRERTAGYLVPRYVGDNPELRSKTLLGI